MLILIVLLFFIILCLWSPLLFWLLVLFVKIRGRKHAEISDSLSEEIGKRDLDRDSKEFKKRNCHFLITLIFNVQLPILVIIGMICTPIHFKIIYDRYASRSDKPSVDDALSSYADSMRDDP